MGWNHQPDNLIGVYQSVVSILVSCLVLHGEDDSISLFCLQWIFSHPVAFLQVNMGSKTTFNKCRLFSRGIDVSLDWSMGKRVKQSLNVYIFIQSTPSKWSLSVSAGENGRFSKKNLLFQGLIFGFHVKVWNFRCVIFIFFNWRNVVLSTTSSMVWDTTNNALFPANAGLFL